MAFSNNTYSVNIGALAGYLDQSSYIQNITYSVSITFNNTTNGESRLGGLFGTAYSNNDVKDIQGISTIESKSTNNYLGGLVGYIGHSNRFINMNIETTVKGQSYNGGFSGMMSSYNHVHNATISAVITGYNYQGGFVGRTDSLNMFNNIDVNGIITGNEHIGGIIGYASNTQISQSSFTGEINGSYMVGGLLGFSEKGSINNSYASVDFLRSNNTYEGGLAGYGYDINILNSYALGTSKSTYSRGIINYGSQAIIENVYSYILINGTTYARSLNSESMTVSYVYSPVFSPNAQTKSISEIIAIMSTRFDSSIWDFENPIDEVGHPSLR
jgi:hypothetical protein